MADSCKGYIGERLFGLQCQGFKLKSPRLHQIILIFTFTQMFTEDVRSNLQNIIQGTVIQKQSNSCTAIRNHLCASYPTSTTVKKDFESKQLIKEEQVRFLKALADSENLLIDEIPAKWIYLTEAESLKFIYILTSYV